MDIDNVEVYGLDESIIASGYPMRTDLPKQMGREDLIGNVFTYPSAVDSERGKRLASCVIGTGHDNFLNGIIVQFDLTAPIKVWTELQRYHFVDFVSSQSTMHRLKDMDLNKAFDEFTDPRMVEILKELQQDYKMKLEHKDVFNQDEIRRAFLKLLMSCPVGLNLTARMTTNYRQLKTIYAQRKNHRLPHWHVFCRFIEELPQSEMITNIIYEVKPLP